VLNKVHQSVMRGCVWIAAKIEAQMGISLKRTYGRDVRGGGDDLPCFRRQVLICFLTMTELIAMDTGEVEKRERWLYLTTNSLMQGTAEGNTCRGHSFPPT